MDEFIFRKYTGPSTESIEIGRARKMSMRNGAGNWLDYEPENNLVLENVVVLHDWKTPQPPTHPLTVLNDVVRRDSEITALKTIVAGLVYMMGGAVVFTRAELLSAGSRDVIVSDQEDMFIVKLEETSQ